MLATSIERQLAPASLSATTGLGDAAWETAAAANGAVLECISQLRSDVATEMLRLDDKAAASLRAALGDFTEITAMLANPATPLPEALREQAAMSHPYPAHISPISRSHLAHISRISSYIREQAAIMLKQTLRREMIDEA